MAINNPITINGINTGYTIGTPVTGSSVTWTSPNTWTASDSFTIASPNTTMNPSGKLQLNGKDADIDINGKSMKEWMEKVEERLNLLSPNPELESEWEELRELGKQYRELEKHIKQKMETWDKLKAQDKDNR